VGEEIKGVKEEIENVKVVMKRATDQEALRYLRDKEKLLQHEKKLLQHKNKLLDEKNKLLDMEIKLLDMEKQLRDEKKQLSPSHDARSAEGTLPARTAIMVDGLICTLAKGGSPGGACCC
jgi:phage-related minor tail protein